MKRPQLTLRRLLIAVGVAAILIAGERNRAFYRHEAVRNGARAQNHRLAAIREGKIARDAIVLAGRNAAKREELLRIAEWSRGLEVSCSRREAYHAGLARKYKVLSVLPWLPVAPDPPPE